MPSGQGVQSQVFTTNGTFILPPNITQIWVEGWGGGGGGGGGQAGQSSGFSGTGNAGGGAGGGGSIASIVPLLQLTNGMPFAPGQSFAITIGTGGGGGARGQNNLAPGGNGSPGGDSFVTANGSQLVTFRGASGGSGGSSSNISNLALGGTNTTDGQGNNIFAGETSSTGSATFPVAGLYGPGYGGSGGIGGQTPAQGAIPGGNGFPNNGEPWNQPGNIPPAQGGAFGATNTNAGGSGGGGGGNGPGGAGGAGGNGGAGGAVNVSGVSGSPGIAGLGASGSGGGGGGGGGNTSGSGVPGNGGDGQRGGNGRITIYWFTGNTGPVGPTGQQGPAGGPQGPTGQIGPTGPAGAGPVGPVLQQMVFASGGTFTVPAGINTVLIEGWGGGGGGGGGLAGSTNQTPAAPGGGGGGAAIRKSVLLPVAPGQNIPVTIGAGGAGGAAGANGASGAATIFGSLAGFSGGNGGIGAVQATFPQGIPGGLGSIAGTGRGKTAGPLTNPLTEAGQRDISPLSTTFIEFTEGSGGWGGTSDNGVVGVSGFLQSGSIGFGSGGAAGSNAGPFAGGGGGGGGGGSALPAGAAGSGGAGGNGSASNGGAGTNGSGAANNSGGGGGGGGGGGNGASSGGAAGSGGNGGSGQLTVYWFQASAGAQGPPGTGSSITAWTNTAFFVDPANSSGLASDANSGLTNTTPILTTLELGRRLFNKDVQVTSVITYMSDDTSGTTIDPTTFSVGITGVGSLTFQGTPQTLHTGGTLNAGTVTINPTAAGGGQPQTVHTTDLGDFTPFVFTGNGGSSTHPAYVHDESGGNAGTLAWVMSQSGGTAKTTRPELSGAAGTLTIGDSYTIKRGSILRLCASDSAAGLGAITFNDFAFDSSSIGWRNHLMPGGYKMNYNRCSFENFMSMGGNCVNCYFGADLSSLSGDMSLLINAGGLILGDGVYSGQLFLTGDVYFAGALSLTLGGQYYTNVTVNNSGIGPGIQVHDITTVPYAVGVFGDGTNASQTGSNGLIWGKGSTGIGLVVVGQGSLLVGAANVPSVTGAGGDFGFQTHAGFVQVARAFNPATGAYTEAGGAATRATTWANFVTSIAGGGFNFQAVAPESGGSVLGI